MDVGPGAQHNKVLPTRNVLVLCFLRALPLIEKSGASSVGITGVTSLSPPSAEDSASLLSISPYLVVQPRKCPHSQGASIFLRSATGLGPSQVHGFRAPWVHFNMRR